MFIELKLKNFRKHTDTTFNFESGLIALRGANEAGKSTLTEAISYAMGGAAQLREPLSEVVTWGQKEGTLKVWLTFAVNGVQYQISRGKSGAEIRDDSQILATGQTEVTKYVETLLGCSVKTATQLMLANQQKLRGTLEEDGAAMKLIEQLADFQLIDRIIGLVQKHRPCGTTSSVEARIQLLEQQLAEPLVDDTGPARQAVLMTTSVMAQAGLLYNAAKVVYDGAQQPARAAQQRIDQATAASRAAEAAAARLASAQAALSQINPKPGPDEATVETLRKGVEDLQRWSRAAAAHKALQAVAEPAWEGPYDDLLAESAELQRRRSVTDAQLVESRIKIRELQAQRINQTACGLCGKDLADVPEVATKNAALDRQIELLNDYVQECQQALTLVDAEAAQYQGIVNDGLRADRLFQQHAEFVTLDRNFTPAKWEWTGPDISQPPTDPSAAYRQALNEVAAYQRDLGRQQQAEAAVQAAEMTLTDTKAAAEAAQAAVGNAEEQLAALAEANTALFTAEAAYRTAAQAVRDAEHELQMQRSVHEVKVQARKGVETSLAQAQKELADMQFNNVLVDTLRKARPSIVEELWNLVGSTVSTIFSDIRGFPSTFMREDDSFTVDGKGIKGLSGSTLDALGLAIRMALTKTFLPNTRFMVLDEPAAAADAERETNMLGVIAASEFDQVLLVTHSDLADAVAAQVIRL